MSGIPQVVRDEIDAGATFVVNHSGGKDSQAMTLQLKSLGIPAEQILVVHAELPEADWDGIREHIETTLPESWLPSLTYCRAGKTFLEMVERRFEKRPEVPSFPSPSTRQCTSDLKRDPIAKVVRQHSKATGQTRYVHCMGIRAQESSSRAKAKTWKLNARESKAGRTIHEWLPIHDWTETMVREIVAQAGQELHWAYGAGMSRLSCCFCVMASKADLCTAARLRPELAAKYIALEERTGYTMSMSREPLSQIVEFPQAA